DHGYQASRSSLRLVGDVPVRFPRTQPPTGRSPRATRSIAATSRVSLDRRLSRGSHGGNMRRYINGTTSRLALSILFLALSLTAPAPALAVSSNYLDVCASGCTYTTLQSALAAVSSPSPDNR